MHLYNSVSRIEIKSNTFDRVAWLDAARAFGIYAIYLGHFGEAAGPAYRFVFQFHVPLFFFLAGCTENYNREESLLKNVKRNIKTILLPAYFFAIMSLIIYVINANADLAEACIWGQLIIKGLVRNTYLAASLWFLTCLFVVKTIFALLKKVKKWYWLVAAGIFMFLIAEYGMSPRPIDSPRYYYNLDSACYYMHFYIIGFLAYPYLKEWLEKTRSIVKSAKTVIAVGLLGYAGLMYFQINVLSYIPIHNMIADSGLRMLKTYLMIGAVIMLAYYLQEVEVLSKVGQDTLYLCGSEYMIKIAVPSICGIFGLAKNLDGPLYVCIYTMILLWAGEKIFVPWEKNIIRKMRR